MGANCSALIEFCNPLQNETNSEAESEPIKYVAFKKANTTEFIFFDNRGNVEKRTERRFISNIFKWLHDLYDPETPGNQHWTQWCVYNDVHSHMSSATSRDRRGVAKGILTWNEKRIGWMQHTVPDWPSSFSEKGMEPFDISLSLYGEHSFHYVEFDHDPEIDEKLQNILRQLRQMNVRITHRCFGGTLLNPQPAIKNLEVIPGLFHVALPSNFVTASVSYENYKNYSVLLSDGRSSYWMGYGCGGFLCEDPDMAELLVEEHGGFQKTDIFVVISNSAEFKLLDSGFHKTEFFAVSLNVADVKLLEGEYYRLTMT